MVEVAKTTGARQGAQGTQNHTSQLKSREVGRGGGGCLEKRLHTARVRHSCDTRRAVLRVACGVSLWKEAAEEKEGTRKLRWADCDDKEEEEDHREAVRKSVEMRQKEKVEPAVTDPGEEGWKRKVLWLDCSDEEQERQEGEAGERSEKCEVWKERVSGRVEMWGEQNEEPEVRRERREENKR